MLSMIQGSKWELPNNVIVMICEECLSIFSRIVNYCNGCRVVNQIASIIYQKIVSIIVAPVTMTEIVRKKNSQNDTQTPIASSDQFSSMILPSFTSVGDFLESGG